MKPLIKKTRCKTANRPGRLSVAILLACATISRCGGAEISLEPIELLDLPLSKLSAVTAETSATARKLNEQKETKNKEAAKVCGEKETEIITAEERRETDVPVFIGFGSAADCPFHSYPPFAADAPWLMPAAEEASDSEPVEIAAEITYAEDVPETAPVEEAAEPAPLAEPVPLEKCVESAPVADVQKPVVKEKAWESRIVAPEADSYDQMKLELQKVIYQVRAIELKTRQAKMISDAELGAMEAAEANSPEADGNEVFVAEENENKQVKPPYTPVSDSTLKALEDMAGKAGADGKGLANAVELAEILYRSGRLEQAAKVYRLAYSAAAADDNVAVDDKAWMLLQVGNCLRDFDAQQAIEAYNQVVTEYSNSMWKDMARTQLELLNWYASDKPGDLVAKNAAQPAGGQLKTEQR